MNRSSLWPTWGIALGCALLSLVGCTTPRQAGPAAPSGGVEIVRVSQAPVDEGANRVFKGTLIAGRDGVMRACALVLESLPPQCGDGIEVRGVKWESVPGPKSTQGVSWADVVLVGRFSSGVFEVSGVRAPDTVELLLVDATELSDPTMNCVLRSAGTGDAALKAELDGIDGYQGSWVSAGTLYVASTADAEVTQSAVRDVYAGPLCIGQISGAVSYHRLLLARDAVRRAAPNLSGLSSVAISLDARGGYLTVGVHSSTPKVVAAVRQQVDPDIRAVVVPAFLAVV